MSWESIDCWFGSNVQKGTPHVSDKMKGRNTTKKGGNIAGNTFHLRLAKRKRRKLGTCRFRKNPNRSKK